MKKIKKNIFLITLTTLLFAVNFSFTYAYWASSINSNNQAAEGTLSIGIWDYLPPGFIGVSQNGSSDNPNYITLDQIGTTGYPLTGSYILMSDIDWGNNAFVPIGGAIGSFSGTFLGNGKLISNVSITQNQTHLGLFARNSGTISGVSINNINITLTSTADLFAGGIAGQNSGTIELSYTTGSINITTSLTTTTNNTIVTARGGGIAGVSSGSINYTHSSMGVTVTASINMNQGGNRLGTAVSKAGGLVGENQVVTGIDHSYATGAVSATSQAVAGGNSTGTAIGFSGGVVGESTVNNGIRNSFGVGAVSLNLQGKTTNTANYGGLSGLGTAVSSYRLTGQSVTSNIGTANTIGSTALQANLRDESWITTNLSNTVAWDTSLFIFDTSHYPLIKDNKYL
jgi:hypothetical protein